MKLLIILLALISGSFPILMNIFKRKSALKPIPESVNDVYDEETYAKWRSYNAEHSRLDLFSSIASLLVTVVLLVTNVYSSFAEIMPNTLIWQTMSVILLESLVGWVVMVGFSYYSTMVIEEKYGFNKSTMKTFIFDKIRELILSFALSSLLGLLMGLLHTYLGDYLVVLFALAMLLFSLLISFLYPILSRIGNKFTPLEEGELRDRLMKLLTDHGYKVRDIKVMDASRRTTKLNAYFAGFGKSKTIVLFDNLVNAMTPDEICAVFAHELGHGLHKDVPKMQALNMINFILMALGVWVSVSLIQLHQAFGFGEINYGFAYIITGILISLIQPLTAILTNAYSRRCEYRADKQAVDEGYGEAMVGALKKLARENFAELAPTKISVLLEYSHPPLADRIDAVNQALKIKKEAK